MPAQCSIDCNRIPVSLGVSPEHLGFPSLTHREGGLWRNTIENNRKRKLWSIRYEKNKGTVLSCWLFEGFSVGGFEFLCDTKVCLSSVPLVFPSFSYFWLRVVSQYPP